MTTARMAFKCWLGNWGARWGQLIGNCTLYAPYAIRRRSGGAWRALLSACT